MSGERTKYCHKCGAMIDYKYDVCPSCGARQPAMPEMRPRIVKNPMLAALLSLLITGAGQVYVGEVWRGVAFFLTVFTIGALLEPYVSFDTLMVIGVAFAIVSAYDAYRLAKARNEW
jgi:TM2 domain-containing membrane protein YozV